MDKAELEQIEKDLNLRKIPILDLSTYIKIQAKRPEKRIGVLKADISSLTSYKKGDIVLFTPYTIEESYSKMCWADLEKHVKLCTIEMPSDRYFSGESNISTIKTIVGVPLSLIEYEIKINP